MEEEKNENGPADDVFTRQYVDPRSFKEEVRFKWPDELWNEGFVPLPKKLLRALPALFPNDEAIIELVTILALADYRRPRAQRPPSLRYLAFVAGLPSETMRRALDKLEASGWLKGPLISDEGVHVKNPRLMDGLAQAIRQVTTDEKS